MNIGIIGATGKAGQLILQEAITRGHDVTAIVRNAAKVTADVTILERDVLALTKDDLNGFDAIVNAFNAAPGEETKHIEVGHGEKLDRTARAARRDMDVSQPRWIL